MAGKTATASPKAPKTAAERAADRAHHLHHVVHHTAHMLSEQGPMNITFVHNNTLLGLQKLHFHDAIARAKQVLGLDGYEPAEKFRDAFAQGRVTEADLDESLTMQPGLDPAAAVASFGDRTVTRGDLIKAAMRHDAARRRPAAGIADAFDPEMGLLDLGPEEAGLVPGLTGAGLRRLESMLDGLGRDHLLGEWLGRHFGLDVPGAVAEALAAGEGPAEARAGDAALEDMGIPGDQRAAYRARAAELWGGDADRALAIEARVVERIAESCLSTAGRVAAVAAALRATPKGVAARALWSAAARALRLPEPLGPLVPATLAPRGRSRRDEAESRPLSGAQRGTLAALAGSVAPLAAAAGERADLRRVAAALADGCLSPEDRMAVRALAELSPDAGLRRDARALAATDADAAFAADCAALADDLTSGRLRGASLVDMVAALTGIDVAQKVNGAMIRVCSAFTDEGLSSWRMPDRHLGLFAAWRQIAAEDALLTLEGAQGWRPALTALPADPTEAVIALLDAMGVPDAQWEDYLARSLVALRGWAGMMFWLETHPGHYKQKSHPADTIQFLAVRLFYEKALLDRIAGEVWQIPARLPDLRDWAARNAPEVMLRTALHAGEVAADLADPASLVLSMSPASAADRADIAALARRHWLHGGSAAAAAGAAQDIARLYRLAAHLGLSPEAVEGGGGESARALLAAADALDPSQLMRIWLEAYEAHYRDEVLNALAQNRGRGRWIGGRDRRPRSQVVFCIDEREENLHRYYAELDPDHETLGAAGFFGVAHAHCTVGDDHATPLCPAVATPAHRTVEVPRDEALTTTWPVAQRRSGMLHAWEAVMWEAERNTVAGFFMVQITGLFNALPLIGRVFAPLGFSRLASRLKSRVVPPVETRLTHARADAAELARLGLSETGLPHGFATAEAADRVEAQLRNWGLTYQFSRIVVICAHRSYSVNNPHENAHDCGACGGKAGGPNSRLFAALANDPAVRTELAARGIEIPEDTWFVGAEHNTANDVILCFDTQDIPAPLMADWKLVSADLEETSRRAARERCRRFRSAPKDATPDRSWDHVQGRSQDLSQVRPEWGHATNAFALVGRRAVTQGLFFDRRGFVISYDPTQDETGRILERILLAVGPVGAGINLEYYFSTVNPDGYGSGTKVPHNVVGMIGVMPGAQGDLATGLPRQMTEVHEAMRLQLIVDAPMHILGEIYGRNPGIQELLDGQWVHLIAHDPATGALNRFVPGVGFVPWDKPLVPLPEVSDSYEWIRGKHDCFLPPARIREPARRWTEARA